MKILIATGVYPPESGGPATYTKLLEERLPALGFTVSVLPFRTVRHLPKIFRHVVYFWKCFWMELHADVVFAQDTVSVGFPAALASLCSGKKFIVRVPGDYAWEQARQRFNITDELEEFQAKKYGWRVELLRSVQKFVVDRALKVIAPSDYMQQIVSKWVDDPFKVVRIYSSIHLPPAYELPEDRPQGFLVLSIARPVPWKNLEGIARAVAREPSWTFKVINDLPHPQAMGWLKSADVFVLNSTYEGLSHLLIEAMALGTPIIATNVGGNPELFANGSEGLIIPPKDDEALYAALKEIESHPDEARTRAHRALERSKEFSIDRAIQQLTNLLKTI